MNVRHVNGSCPKCGHKQLVTDGKVTWCAAPSCDWVKDYKTEARKRAEDDGVNYQYRRRWGGGLNDESQSKAGKLGSKAD